MRSNYIHPNHSAEWYRTNLFLLIGSIVGIFVIFLLTKKDTIDTAPIVFYVFFYATGIIALILGWRYSNIILETIINALFPEGRIGCFINAILLLFIKLFVAVLVSSLMAGFFPFFVIYFIRKIRKTRQPES